MENIVENDKSTGRVIYDDEGWTLSSGTYDISNIIFTYVEPKYEKYHDTGDINYINEPSNYHILKIIIPVSFEESSNKKFDVEISHVDSNSVVLSNFCNEIKTYFQNKLNYSDIINSNNITCINS